jgi:hypothetical protein
MRIIGDAPADAIRDTQFGVNVGRAKVVHRHSAPRAVMESAQTHSGEAEAAEGKTLVDGRPVVWGADRPACT